MESSSQRSGSRKRSAGTGVASSAQPRVDFIASARKLGRFLYTNNPFYVLSASLVFWGLRISFDTSAVSFETGALMIGLTGYVLLLSAAACLLIRYGQVWDDVRTVLLLVVLMLLAISVSFDGVLAADSVAGSAYFVGGLLFAVIVSELLLYFIRLRLPAGFRIPYYLILALFFLYPPALTPLLDDPSDPALYWALFAFSPLAGVLFLTLLPAVRKGPPYVRKNGSPWPWPWYPWLLFATLALGVFGRSFYLCYSFHFVGGQSTVFAPYFWVPFLWAINILLLEIALRSHLQKACGLVLLIPIAIAALAATAPLAQGDDCGFLDLFVKHFGRMPLQPTLFWVCGFYGYALFRQARGATVALTVAFLLLAVVGPNTVDFETLSDPQWMFLLSGGLFWSIVARIQMRSEHWCLAFAFLVSAVDAASLGNEFGAYCRPILGSLLLALLLIIGAAFRDPFARFLRVSGTVLLVGVGLFVLFANTRRLCAIPCTIRSSYAINLATVSILYGYFIRKHAYYITAVAILAGSLVTPCRYLYGLLGEPISGWEQVAWGSAFFVTAILISLSKGGTLHQLFSYWRYQWAGAGAGATTTRPCGEFPGRSRGCRSSKRTASSKRPKSSEKRPNASARPNAKPSAKASGKSAKDAHGRKSTHPQNPSSGSKPSGVRPSSARPTSKKRPHLHFLGVIRGAARVMIWQIRF